MGFGKNIKKNWKVYGATAATGGVTGASSLIGGDTLTGGKLSSLGAMIPGLGGSMSEGQSGNTQLDALTAEQRALYNQYIGSIYPNVSKNMNALQSAADIGYNAYDAARGDEITQNMRNDINTDRLAQLSAVKGGPMSRFSLAGQALNTKINDNASRQLTALEADNLTRKTQTNESAYANKMNALNSINSLGSSLAGAVNTQNQETYKPGWMDKATQWANLLGTGAQAASIFGKM